ncbi:hydantoinase/oxoprolinase family protein [Rhizomonospora bruguierae]|uniref:hydantoinase/oxoprolinase family protein n=1 Tax=Rhizomonospora bruguierae TaxID=1581705 RepID=UPI001BD025FE|nr:hydantoinase/oxoprolinase family protein [Micromonospora sp. NBRC 107566]
MPYVLGVDIGGTFTDVCVVDVHSGQEFVAKAPTTPDDLIEGLFEGLRLAAEQLDLTTEAMLAETVRFSHATTQTTNVMFTWTGGSVVGLLTTRGFADELLIMRARGRVAGKSLTERRHLRATDKPPQIVPRERMGEVAERVDRHGRVVEEIDTGAVRRTVEDLLANGVEAFAVSLLWSHQNPVHELAVRDVIHEVAPHAHASLSHQIAPITGEYERASTTVVNAYVGPTLERYLQRLEQQLKNRGLRVPILVFQAGGGVNDVRSTLPVSTIESGPAAGMVAVRKLSVAAGRPNIIATDVGGTTFKVGLVINGRWTVAPETIINQYTLLSPMIDIVSIGAGGGSIAWADSGRLRIGPMSAGASPGPACYGWGGQRPTVTDADVLLGYLAPERFLDGRLRLRTDLATEAVKRHVADPLFGGDVIAAAAGIRQVVDAHMSDLVRKATIERGYDPREFVLAAYGGAGPVHAAGYARNLGVREIVVPLSATAYSAFGAVVSDTIQSAQRSVSHDLSEDDEALEGAYRELEARARRALDAQGLDGPGVQLSRWADMRYERQLHDVRVGLPDGDHEGSISARLARAFDARYRLLYGDAARLGSARAVVLRIGVDAVAPNEIALLDVVPGPAARRAVEPASRRDVYWPEERRWLPTAVHIGSSLRPGGLVEGPAIVEQPGTSIVIPADARGQVDPARNLIISFSPLGD